jgi:hypothetical protein
MTSNPSHHIGKKTGGALGASSRPFLVKATRRAVMWHPEQIKVRCSKPRIATVCSGTTFINIISYQRYTLCNALLVPPCRTSTYCREHRTFPTEPRGKSLLRHVVAFNFLWSARPDKLQGPTRLPIASYLLPATPAPHSLIVSPTAVTALGGSQVGGRWVATHSCRRWRREVRSGWPVL